MSKLDLEGKRIVVTGAARGLGQAFAVAFASAGSKVFCVDIEDASETAAMTQGFAALCDVTSTSSCQSVANRARELMGGVDAVINNAGLYAGLDRRHFTELDEAAWDRVMAVNVKGVWQMSRALVPLLRASGSGAIVNIASATVFSGSPQWMHYVASKGAVIAMSRTMARELGGDNIRVNVLAPGFTLTEASMQVVENARSYGVDRAALRRPAEVEDIVGGALFLASPLSAYMTGQTMVIDGGRQFI
jgi:NAD(P)-dependent dehydrogenase (short-subunit alcohol dehydrogenase family)